MWKVAAKMGFRKAIIHVADSLMTVKKYKEAIEWYKKVLDCDAMKDIRRKVYYASLEEFRTMENHI
jgi:hypothetical protein